MSAPKVLIAFYSHEGSTEDLANAIAESARAQGPKCACVEHLNWTAKN